MIKIKSGAVWNSGAVRADILSRSALCDTSDSARLAACLQKFGLIFVVCNDDNIASRIYEAVLIVMQENVIFEICAVAEDIPIEREQREGRGNR